MNINLTEGAQQALPNQLLTVRAQSTVLPPPRVEAYPAEGPAIEIEPVDRAPGLISLPVAGPTLIRLRPAQLGASFPHGVAVTVTIGPDEPSADQLILRSVDVSGMVEIDLLHLEPAGGHIVVTVLQVSDLPLPPLAHQARIAAREVLGVRSVSPGQAVAVQVAIDGSASMRQHLASPVVSQILQLVTGLSCVIATSAQIPVELTGQSQVRLPARSLDALAESAVSDALAMAPSIGFRSDLVRDAGDRGLTFMITDAVPADIQHDRTDALHLVIISGGGEAMAQQRPPAVGATVMVPRTDWNPSAAEVRDLVFRLLMTYQARSPERPR